MSKIKTMNIHCFYFQGNEGKMKKQLTIEMMQKEIHDFCKEREWDQFHTPKDLAIGLSTESNELLDLFRFKNEKECLDQIHSENVKDELADVLYFLLRFSSLYEIDLSEAFINKMKKNREKYSIEQVVGKNKKYTEYE